MSPLAIFWPVLALMGLTLLVLLVIPFRRFQAVFARQVIAEDFRYGESRNVPGKVSLPNRVYMNLLELPLLFYALCGLLYLLNGVDHLALGLAWTYVGLRLVHALITLTYNRVMDRFLAFAASNFMVLGLWLKTVGALAALVPLGG